MKAKGTFKIGSMMIVSVFVLICTACVSVPPSELVGETSGFIKRFDKNNDERVSRREFSGSAREFNRLDKNNDGYIEEWEVPKEPPPPRPKRRR